MKLSFTCHVIFVVLISSSFLCFCRPLGKKNYANWMERAKDVIGNRTLQEITLPGTHDSGSYHLTDELIGTPAFEAELVKVADFFHLPVGNLIDGWAKSQTDDFYSQFLDGIRFVDVRCVWDSSANAWKAHHGAVVGNLIEVLLQNTQLFLENFSNEVLIMQLSHTDGQTKDQEQILINLIQQYLGKYLWPKSLGFKPINQMIQMGKNILLTLTFDNLPENIWPDSTINTTYANSPSLSTMESYNVQQTKLWQEYGVPSSELYGMFWTLTPNATTILEMILPKKPHNLIELAHIAGPHLEDWFNSQIEPLGYKYPILGNILIVDDYSNTDVMEIVLKGLNLTSIEF